MCIRDRGYDAVLFCLGISSVGLSKEEYFKITHTLTLHFAETFKKENPNGKFCYISGAGTDSVSYTHLDVYKRQLYLLCTTEMDSVQQLALFIWVLLILLPPFFRNLRIIFPIHFFANFRIKDS